MPWAPRVSAVCVPLSPDCPQQGAHLHFAFSVVVEYIISLHQGLAFPELRLCRC